MWCHKGNIDRTSESKSKRYNNSLSISFQSLIRNQEVYAFYDHKNRRDAIFRSPPSQ